MAGTGFFILKFKIASNMAAKSDFFCDWIVDQVHEVDTATCNACLENMQEALKNTGSDMIFQCLNEMLAVLSDKVSNFHHQFISQQRERESSDTFAFWTNYTNMVLPLLDYTRAEREGHWGKTLISCDSNVTIISSLQIIRIMQK